MNPLSAETHASPVAAGSVAMTRAGERAEPSIALNVEALAWCGVLAIAAALRFADLSVLPLGPAEGPRARAALEMSRGTATAEWGADLTSALTTLSLKLFGDSAWAARVAPAALGVLAVAAVACYRPLIGRAAALIAALLLAVSPVAVVTARTLGPEAAALPLALLAPPLSFGVFVEGRVRLVAPLTLVAGLGLGTGAVFLATCLGVAVWLAIESRTSGCARPESVLRALVAAPRWAALSLAAVIPGLALAIVRYGAGPERLSLSAIRAWSGAPELASGSTGWYYVPAVLVAYEPLTLLLGAVGLALVIHRWRARGAGARLAAVWALTGFAFTVLWLHRESGQLLALTAPLALLAGLATVALADRLERARGWRSWLPLVPLVAAAGYTALLLARWADRRVVYADEAASVLIVGVGALIAAHIGRWLTRGAVVGPLLVVAWVVLGGMTLHAATAAASRGGSEILTGVRALPETAAITARLDALDPAGGPVCVERRLWPALAWPLRGREVRTFAGTPPCYPAVVRVEGESETGTAGSRGAVTIAERWSPSSVDGVGIVRWWAFRNRWGPAERLQALVAAREAEAPP